MDILDKAIERLKVGEQTSLTYYGKPLMICYSGGKDSDVLIEIAKAANINFEVVHSHTTADAPETVGQCTGLKDKNKKLIFEGDIVERYSYYDDIWGFSYTAECYGVIVWNTNDYCWNIKVNDELIPFNDYDWDISMVVGNIHDNPELLEVKE